MTRLWPGCECCSAARRTPRESPACCGSKGASSRSWGGERGRKGRGTRNMAKKKMSEKERADYWDWRNACVRYAKTLDADEHDPREATCLVADARGGLYVFSFRPYRRGE